jgi:hypothetical protein
MKRWLYTAALWWARKHSDMAFSNYYAACHDLRKAELHDESAIKTLALKFAVDERWDDCMWCMDKIDSLKAKLRGLSA